MKRPRSQSRTRTLALAALGAVSIAATAGASHIPGKPCSDCTSHKYWPTITGDIKKAGSGAVTYRGTSRPDELLGHHGSDDIRGGEGSDVLWGDWDPKGQPSTQKDLIYGGNGTDFIYGSHGYNEVYGGNGNDVISVHYGRGRVDCGPGRDVYHVPRSRKGKYRFIRCEKVDYRPESVRGGPLKPLS
ncbi:MAG: hypothetical protein M3376_12210 [Actinomycetota bacterium]|nr:hypothetical protein [Actinomycetota bacterium]